MATTRTTASRRLRRGLIAAAAALATAALSSCAGSGFGAQTDQIYQPGPGISVRHDGVYLLNGALVTDGSGNATVIGALLNQTNRVDRLQSVVVSGSGGAAAKVTIATGTVVLMPHRPVQLADTGQVRVVGDVPAGTFQRVQLTFANGAPISVELPVLVRAGDFANVPIGPLPPPTTPSVTVRSS